MTKTAIDPRRPSRTLVATGAVPRRFQPVLNRVLEP
jgi:hypothetical protein